MSFFRKKIKLQHWALVLILLGLLLMGLMYNPTRSNFALLHIKMWWISFSIGALLWLAIESLCSSKWSRSLTPIFQKVSGFILFYPLFLFPFLIKGIYLIYPWAQGEKGEQGGHHFYSSVMAFQGRTFGYFIILLALFWGYRRNKSWSSLALPILLFTASFLAIEFIMSLESPFISTIFGLYYIVGCLIASLAFIIILVTVSNFISKERYPLSLHTRESLGAYLLGLNVLWLYLAYNQYLLIWYGNLPSEVPYYLKRSSADYQSLMVLLLVGHAFFPFVCLLSSKGRQNIKVLFMVSLVLFTSHYFDLYYLIMPNYQMEFVWGANEFGSLILTIGLGIFFLSKRWFGSLPLLDKK